MGNQNQTVKNRKSSTVRTVQRTTADRVDQTQTIDLDEIVEQWIWYMWNRTKTKSLARYKREELILTTNWKRVAFSQNDVRYQGLLPVRLPQSQTLFRTNFNNKTACEQCYLLKTDRSTRSTFKFSFQNRLIKSEDSTLILTLPNEIVETGGGIKREQSIECGQDSVKEYDMQWSVNSQVYVPARSCLYAELNIDEEELEKDFTISIRFSGRISAKIATQQSPDHFLKFFDGDIVQIIRQMMETHPRRCAGLEIIEDNPPTVQYTMRGKCSFRYGIEQHVVLKQTSLDSSISTPHMSNYNYNQPISIDYRPLRPRVASSANDIELHIDDDA